ncbi:hypothetical protein B0H16DRAFT_1723938 [Mycena metata]|uniref:Uncharacterized protein n=1 Tax=Mycena metata TaxID=1033252 RepID=A0AAD7NAH8_9AGAR|nr:hypothetical protein B0H16DRAFT_1723938 [Mycena metata]
MFMSAPDPTGLQTCPCSPSHHCLTYRARFPSSARASIARASPSYTIDNALPRLYALALPADTLSSPFYIPNEGFPNFLQYRMRVFAHTLLRAITHDFIHTDSLPGFPSTGAAEASRVDRDPNASLCAKQPSRLVSRTLKIRTERLSAGDLSWLAVPLDIPAEAFQMLKLSVYLCNFVAYVMPSPFPADHDARILFPLMELSQRQALLTGARSDYAEYDSRGQYKPASLLFSDPGTVQNSQHNVILSPTPLHSAPLAFGFTSEQ